MLKKSVVTLISVALAALLPLGLFAGCKRKSGDSEGDETTGESAHSDIPKAPASDFAYQAKEDGVTITRYLGSETELNIPTMIDGRKVVAIGRRAFADRSELAIVVLPGSVNRIESEAFSHCSGLKAVDLPKNLRQIDDQAFYFCSALEEIALPDGLTKLGEQAFFYCKFKKINIPKTVTEWGISVFGTSSLEEVTFEDGLESVGERAFAGTLLKKIELPDSVKSVGEGAFAECPLETIALGAGLTAVGDLAFESARITEIVIPASVESLGANAFVGCRNLERVKFEGNAPTFESLYTQNPGDYTVCYHEGASGFDPDGWNGHPTEIW